MKVLMQKVRVGLVNTLIGFIYAVRYSFAMGAGPRCRYFPSCSEYATQSLKEHGPIRGLLLGVWRVLRCNPWSKGGIDIVPDQFHLTCCGHRWPRSYHS
jgi:putative membrane protein insertion efficiency factor